MRKSALLALGLVVTLLVTLGLVVLSSASEANGVKLYGDAQHFMKRQFIYLGVGVFLSVVAAWLDYHFWRKFPILMWLAFGAVLVLLVLVLPEFLGRAVKGSCRWLNVGPVNIQPSEFAKLMTVISLAVWLDRAGTQIGSFMRGIFVPGLMIAALAVPILREPDFGSVMVVGSTGLLILLVAGVNLWWWFGVLAGGFGVVAVKVLSNPNRMARIAAWFGSSLSVGADIADKAAEQAAYQARMALVAIKNGGILGVGLGESMQKQYYLPEAHTDFIFAVGAEELGIIFTLAVLFLFLSLFALTVYIAWHAADRFGRYLVVGMGFILFFQAIFNLGVVCAALPTKGMALPFFSYGGTNMLSAFVAVGTIFSVGIRTVRGSRRKVRGHGFPRG